MQALHKHTHAMLQQSITETLLQYKGLLMQARAKCIQERESRAQTGYNYYKTLLPNTYPQSHTRHKLTLCHSSCFCIRQTGCPPFP